MATRRDQDAGSIESAIEAIKQAADSLGHSAASHEVVTAKPTPSAVGESLYHQHLRQRGALVDVEATTDLSTLPPQVTHVKLPNGDVIRLGYS